MKHSEKNPFNVHYSNLGSNQEINDWILHWMTKDVLTSGVLPIKVLKNQKEILTHDDFDHYDDYLSYELHGQILICADAYFKNKSDETKFGLFHQLYRMIIDEKNIQIDEEHPPFILFHWTEDIFDEDIEIINTFLKLDKITAFQKSFEQAMYTNISVAIDIGSENMNDGDLEKIIGYMNTLIKEEYDFFLKVHPIVALNHKRDLSLL